MRLRATAIAATACAAIGGAYVTGRIHGAPGTPPVAPEAAAAATPAVAAPPATAGAPAAPAAQPIASLAGAVRPPTVVEPIWTDGILGTPATGFAPAADAPEPAPAPQPAPLADEPAPPADAAPTVQPPDVPPPPVVVQPPPPSDDRAWAPTETTYVIVREYYGCPANEAVLIPTYCDSYGIVDADAYCLLHIARCANRPFVTVFDDWHGRCHRDYNSLLFSYGLSPEVFVIDPGPVTWWPSVYDRPFACWRQHRWTGVALSADEYRALVSFRIAVQYQGWAPDRFFGACRGARAPVVVIHDERDRCGAGGRDWHGEPLRIHSERPWRMPTPDRVAWRSGTADVERAQVAHLTAREQPQRPSGQRHQPAPTVTTTPAPTAGRAPATTGAPTHAVRPEPTREPAPGAQANHTVRPEPNAQANHTVRPEPNAQANHTVRPEPTPAPTASPTHTVHPEPTPTAGARPMRPTTAPTPVPPERGSARPRIEADRASRGGTADHAPTGDGAADPGTRHDGPTRTSGDDVGRTPVITMRHDDPTPAAPARAPTIDGGNHASTTTDTRRADPTPPAPVRAPTIDTGGHASATGDTRRGDAATRVAPAAGASDSAAVVHAAPPTVRSAPSSTPEHAAPPASADRHASDRPLVDEHRVERPTPTPSAAQRTPSVERAPVVERHAAEAPRAAPVIEHRSAEPPRPAQATTPSPSSASGATSSAASHGDGGDGRGGGGRVGH